MREKILEDIKHEYYQEKFSNDGEIFVAWYLRNNRYLNCELPEIFSLDKKSL